MKEDCKHEWKFVDNVIGRDKVILTFEQCSKCKEVRTLI